MLLHCSAHGISKIHSNFSLFFSIIYRSSLLTNKYDWNTDENTPLKFATQQYSLRHMLTSPQKVFHSLLVFPHRLAQHCIYTQVLSDAEQPSAFLKGLLNKILLCAVAFFPACSWFISMSKGLNCENCSQIVKQKQNKKFEMRINVTHHTCCYYDKTLECQMSIYVLQILYIISKIFITNTNKINPLFCALRNTEF